MDKYFKLWLILLAKCKKDKLKIDPDWYGFRGFNKWCVEHCIGDNNIFVCLFTLYLVDGDDYSYLGSEYCKFVNKDSIPKIHEFVYRSFEYDDVELETIEKENDSNLSWNFKPSEEEVNKHHQEEQTQIEWDHRQQ